MKLTILERIQLLNILPKEGDIVTLIQVKGLQDCIAISADLANDTELKIDEQGRLSYLTEKDPNLEIKPNAAQITIVKEKFEELNKDKKMHIDLIGLYQKFEKL